MPTANFCLWKKYESPINRVGRCALIIDKMITKTVEYYQLFIAKN